LEAQALQPSTKCGRSVSKLGSGGGTGSPTTGQQFAHMRAALHPAHALLYGAPPARPDLAADQPLECRQGATARCIWHCHHCHLDVAHDHVIVYGQAHCHVMHGLTRFAQAAKRLSIAKGLGIEYARFDVP
jgi:hypothetical protein